MLSLQETLINSSGSVLFRIYSYTTRQLHWKSITKSRKSSHLEIENTLLHNFKKETIMEVIKYLERNNNRPIYIKIYEIQ